MKTITQAQLLALLSNVKSACPIGFTALTDARPHKTGNPFAEIRKLSRVWPIAGANYESAVNRALAREGEEATFQAKRAQYDRISPCLGIMRGTGNPVLLCAFSPRATQSAPPAYFVRKTAGGPLVHVPKETIAPFIPQRETVSARQADAGLSASDCVVWRAFGLGNILSISLNGERYKIRG